MKYLSRMLQLVSAGKYITRYGPLQVPCKSGVFNRMVRNITENVCVDSAFQP